MNALRNLKEEAQYDLVAPTSMGVRLTPADRQQVSTSHQFTMQATSAESNVLSVSASLGLRTKVLTAFVKGSPISRFIQSELRSRNIAYEGPERDAGGPWGYRHQINFSESGFGVRGAQVHNDRAGEVGRTLSVRDFDLDRLFEKEGVRILHLSGLVAALSPETSQFCLELVRRAKQSGTLISFDMNYRESFWKGREQELSTVFSEIASLSDILMNYQPTDAQGIPETLSLNPEQIDTFIDLVHRVHQQYPDAQLITSTVRGEQNANENLWGAVMLTNDRWYIEPARTIPVLDRIGGGDGFASGVLYGILAGYTDPQKWLELGWASGAMAVTTLTDYIQPDSEAMLQRIYSGQARIKR